MKWGTRKRFEASDLGSRNHLPGAIAVLRKVAALAVVIQLAGITGVAAQQTMVLSYGSNDCVRFLRAPAHERREYLVWAEGFITGLNMGATGNRRMTGLFWVQSRSSAWLDNYCSKSPHSGFVYAVMGLRVSLGGKSAN
jgi:hypothetical protein